MITPDIIRQEVMQMIRESCVWDIPAEGDNAQDLTRTLFYICGAYDLAHNLINRLEGRKDA